MALSPGLLRNEKFHESANHSGQFLGFQNKTNLLTMIADYAYVMNMYIMICLT
jgi:hypothetical protein